MDQATAFTTPTSLVSVNKTAIGQPTCPLSSTRGRPISTTPSASSIRMVTTTAPSTSAPQTEQQKDYGGGNPVFGRIVTAMVTPFKLGGEEVDYNEAERLAAYLVSSGSDALVIAGTTGESPTLTWAEQYELFNVVKGAVGQRAKVIAGAGSNSTTEAIEATHRAKRLGLDGTLQVSPYYNKPPQAGLIKHFEMISKSEPDLPIMLYNIPSRTGIKMQPETVTYLNTINNIVALKQATDSMEEFVNIRKNTDESFHIYAGDDGLTLPFLSLGASGVVSVASHFIGDKLKEMVNKYRQGKVAEATAIHLQYSRLFTDLFCMTNPIPTKTALRLQGWSVGPPRLPLVDTPPEVEAKLAELLRSLSLL